MEGSSVSHPSESSRMHGRRNKLVKSTKNVSKTNNAIYMDLKEIIREYALCYLPAKAVYRSSTVCRDWKLQISSPFFVHNQSISFRSVSGLFFQSPEGSPSFISFDRMAYGVPDPALNFLPEPVDVRASSNGLLCCQGRTEEKVYYVCNPVNQQWKKLPKPTANHGSNPAIILVFEPSLMNFVAEYKVVCVFPSEDIDQAYEFEIYSSTQDSWKVSAEMFFSSTKVSFLTGLHVNGVAYWPMSSRKIIAFDLKQQRAVTISGYCVYSPSYGTASWLGLINGNLCTTHMSDLTVTVSTLQNKHSSTMPMNSHAHSWQAVNQIHLKTADVPGEAPVYPRILAAFDNVIAFEARHRVFCHDLKTRRTTLVWEKPLSSSCNVFPYVNSLVSLI